MKIVAAFVMIITLTGQAWGADIFVERFDSSIDRSKIDWNYFYEDFPDSENPLFNFYYNEGLVGEAWERQSIISRLRLKLEIKLLSHPDKDYVKKTRMKLAGCYPGSQMKKVGFCKIEDDKKK